MGKASMTEQSVPTDAVERPLHLVGLAAAGKEALVARAARLAGYLTVHPKLRWQDVCFSANAQGDAGGSRMALVAADSGDARAALAAYSRGQANEAVVTGEAVHRREIVFFYTGQGAQYVDMGRGLYETQPVFRAAFQRCEEILREYLPIPLYDVVYPAPGKTSPLDDTTYTQPALFALEYALTALWRSWGIEPAVALGHSLGEYAAACAAGVFTVEEGLRLVSARSRLMEEKSGPGEMVTVFADEKTVEKVIAPFQRHVSVAAINGPDITVISGARDRVREAVRALEEARYRTMALPISHAFHSPLTHTIMAEFQQILATVDFKPPRIALVSNVTGQFIADEIATARYWLQHLQKPVRFVDAMQTIHRAGYELLLEIGPEPVLLGLDQSLPPGMGAELDQPVQWLPSLRQGHPDWQPLLHSLGALYVSGVTVDWHGFDQPYHRHPVDLPGVDNATPAIGDDATPGEEVPTGMVAKQPDRVMQFMAEQGSDRLARLLAVVEGTPEA